MPEELRNDCHIKRPIRSIRVIRVRKTSQFSNSIILDILDFLGFFDVCGIQIYLCYDLRSSLLRNSIA